MAKRKQVTFKIDHFVTNVNEFIELVGCGKIKNGDVILFDEKQEGSG